MSARPFSCLRLPFPPGAGALLVLLATASPAVAGAAPVRVGVIDSGSGAADPTGHGSEVAAVLRRALGPRLPRRGSQPSRRPWSGRTPIGRRPACAHSLRLRKKAANSAKPLPGFHLG
jgi:hypothetical protein